MLIICALWNSEGIEELISLQKQKDEEKKYNNNNGNHIAFMYAEALQWRCHRRLASVYLSAVKDVKIYNILNISDISIHNLTSFACMENSMLTYPSKNK